MIISKIQNVCVKKNGESNTTGYLIEQQKLLQHKFITKTNTTITLRFKEL